MNRVKMRFIGISAFLLLLMLCLGIAFGSGTAARAAVKTYRPTELFRERSGGEVSAYQLDAEAEKAYLTLVLSDGGKVEYQRDLALKWYVAAEAESSGTLASPGTAKYFSMSLVFPSVSFQTFTITFQSEEENVSKDGQSVNEVIFDNEGGLHVYVKDAAHQSEEDYVPAEKLEVAAGELLVLSLDETDCEAGAFNLLVNGEKAGKLTNVGGYYMEYRTSGTANVPMAFTAELAEGAANQKVLVQELNGQSYEVTGGTAAESADTDGTVRYSNGSVTDNAPPVLVLNEKVYAFTLGQRFNLTYKSIDVCDSSVSTTRGYYMAKKGESGYLKPNLTTDDDYKTLTTSTYFMPPDDSNDEQVEYVSIRFSFDDESDSSKDYYVYLSWYADLEADVVHTLGEGEQKFDYILVDRDRSAPCYTIIDTNEETLENEKTADYDAVKEAYQDSLDTLAKDAVVGDGAYFYLPSLRSLFRSDYADYRNLRFSIYYFKPGQAAGATASSETSLRYNNLRFELDKEGTYKFRILAADAAGNTLMLYQNGELVKVTSSNIWDIDAIPDFTIKVRYSGATIEDPGEQDIGYRGSSYSIEEFDIIALEDCDKDYTLYYFDQTKLKEGQSLPSYSTLVKEIATYIEGDYRDCFVEKNKYNADITEDDPAWDRTDNAYHWDPKDTPGTFIPQEKGYYVVKLLLTDHNLSNRESTAYQVINVYEEMDVTPQQIDWLSNNVLSVVFLSLSAVLAVVIVLLFVIPQPQKNVEDVDLEKLKGKKKK